VTRECVVIPALNAASTVGEVVAGVKKFAPDVPVLVVDDGSQDATSTQATRAGATVVRHPFRKGKGAGLATGFAWALEQGHDAVCTLDADGQHAPSELPRLLDAHRQDEDALIIGARAIRRVAGPMPPLNQIGNRVSTFFISLLAGQNVCDSQSGFRVYPRRLLEHPPRSTGFEAETELIFTASRLGIPIRAVPVSTIYHPPEKHTSHFRRFDDTVRIIRWVLRDTLSHGLARPKARRP